MPVPAEKILNSKSTLIMPRFWLSEFAKDERVAAKLHQPAHSSFSFSGKLLPSGALSVGFVPKKKIAVDDVRYESCRGVYSLHRRNHWHYQDGIVSEAIVTVERPEQVGLASVHNHHNAQRARYGLRGITPLGRKRVREGAYLIEKRYRGRVGFYTLTCPYTEPLLIASYNEQISYIMRLYFQELRRAYERAGTSFCYVSVLEIQPTRYATLGEPVLHIHYIAPCFIQGTREWVLEADEIRGIWGRVLHTVVGVSASMGASIDAALIYSSAVGYLSKYMSKGSEEVVYLAQLCPDQLPSQWWSCSRNVRQALARATVQLPDSVCHILMYGGSLDSFHPLYCRYRKEIYIFVAGQEKLVGISANMSEVNANILRPPNLIKEACKLL